MEFANLNAILAVYIHGEERAPSHNQNTLKTFERGFGLMILIFADFFLFKKRMTHHFQQTLFLLQPLALTGLVTSLRAQTMAASGLFEKLFAFLERSVSIVDQENCEQIRPNRFSKPVRSADDLHIDKLRQ